MQCFWNGNYFSVACMVYLVAVNGFRTKNDVYILAAPDQKTMLYWLQELQRHRRAYSSKKAKSLPLKLSLSQSVIEVYINFGSLAVAWATRLLIQLN